MAERPLIAVVDDDESVRESLPDLLREFGFAARAFTSAETFLASDCAAEARCLMRDITMPGMSSLDLQPELRRRKYSVPIVFITAHWDEALRPRVIKQGPVECLFKPFILYHRAMDHRSVVGISWCHGRLTLRPHDVSFQTGTP
jgi:FixJ family two-component response regulator